MEFLPAIEQHGLVRLLKGSFYAYPVVNALHIAAIGVLLTSVWLMDLRVVGALRTLPEQPFLAALRRVALIAFACAVLTGAMLFSVRAREYAANPVFLVKMGLIALAGLNLLVFMVLNRRRRAGELASGSEQAVAGVSALLWAAVLLAGRFIGFV